MDIPWERAKLIRHQAAMRLADPDLDETPGDQLAMTFNPAHAGKLFVGTSHTFESLVTIAERGEPLPRFPLAVSMQARTKFEQREVTSQNIVGMLPGTDLSEEYVALTAHVDHLGVGDPIKGDKIYHGAMDNAAGVATMLDLADTLHSTGAKTRRSLLFIIVTGEEKGLLGSKYFVAHPTVPLAKIVADLNVDMFLPIYPLKYLTVHGLEESDLGPLLTTVAAAEGVEAQTDPAPERNVFIRSDQYSFIKKGIPSIFFGFGYAKGSPEETVVKQWITERYHSPADNLKQPVDLGAAAKFNKILLQLAEAVADHSQRPQWNPDSFFRRYAKYREFIRCRSTFFRSAD
jgi:Zn-dependent M28 family amino/carboxypeptidase